MAYEEVLQNITLNADASLASATGVAGLPGAPANPSGLQYRFVKMTGEHQVGLMAATSDTAIGVLQSKPQKAADEATIGIFGVSKVEAAGAIAAGAPVYSDNVGRATATVAGAIYGYAIHSTAAAGELATVLLRF